MTKQELETRLSELEEKDQLTEAEQRELDKLKQELDDADGEAMVRVGPQIPESLYERLKKAARREHVSVAQYMVRAAEAYLENGEDAGRTNPHDDIRSLCELSTLYTNATHPQIKSEIGRRVKRQYGVDLNTGAANAPRGNGDDEVRDQFKQYQQAGGKKFKDLSAWKQASAEDRASALKNGANQLDRFFGFEF